MINDALIFIAKEMNDYFRDVIGISEDCVIVSAINNRDGTITVNTENKIVITVANIEADIIKNNIGIHNRSLPDAAGVENLNIYIVIAASYTNYNESLQFIFNAITFLKQNTIFIPSQTNDLNKAIDKIIIEMVNMPMENVGHLWSALKASYMPSAIYKVGILYSTAIAGEQLPA